MLKRDLFIILVWFIISLIILTISTILVYTQVINISGRSVFLFINGVLLFLILGFLVGNIKQKKGLVSGVLYGIIIVIILMLIQVLGFEDKLTLNLLSKYLVFILSTGVGGSLGVNFKPIVK
ncbi:MAG: TIGR04086 family membrane protein [Bacilli bacterium]|nr:TIGR04086 family membrane protein [Bacilli bacterium]